MLEGYMLHKKQTLTRTCQGSSNGD
jgi:hypothetical protein